MAHLHPTAELAERALLPDDPGQALALTRVLFGETPRMFNHHRGLWGYTGIALDGAALTVQSTGIGGPSAAIVVGELHALGLRRAVRIGRAWALDGDAARGRARGGHGGRGGRRRQPRARRGRARGARRGADRGAARRPVRPDRVGRRRSCGRAWEAVAFDLESAAVLAAAARAGIPAACLVAIEGAVEPEDVAERLGRGALPALAPVSIS